MSKAFLAAVLQDSLDCTGVAAQKAADDLLKAIVSQLLTEGGFTLPSFGTFSVQDTPARTALNPRTQEKVKVASGSTVRFKASPVLKDTVKTERQKAAKRANPMAAKSSPAAKSAPKSRKRA